MSTTILSDNIFFEGKNKEMRKMAETKNSLQKKSKMPIVKCSCGTKILIVPDLKEMDQAIKNHILEHKKITGLNLTEEPLAQEIIKALSKFYS
jgi:hypothetical protein